MFPPVAKRRFPPHLADFLAFGLGLGTAWYLDWTTTDLIWSLWLCSLVLGYLTLLAGLGGMAVAGTRELWKSEMSKTGFVAEILVGVVACLFFLVFFSLHFGGFHAGHSLFLQKFFPVEGVPSRGFIEAFTNPPLLWKMVFEYLFVPYGLFLVPMIIAERHHLLRPLRQAFGKGSSDGGPADPDEGKRQGDLLVASMMRPYRNVIRMHLLIFFFAGCFFLKVDSFLIYAAVYAVYFFPWRALVRKPETSEPSLPDPFRQTNGSKRHKKTDRRHNDLLP